jgi:D-alanyl-lipoteichoic acid acyltransferase DltB (MBOAT superfamily)
VFFNSLAFALFLPTVVGVYWVLPAKWRTAFLLVASYVFYAWWDVRFLGLIVISTLVDFTVGRRLTAVSNSGLRKAWLLMSLVSNLGMLGFFKYWGFFVESTSTLLVSLGLEPNLPLLQIVLPVGISFYTFQTLSYTIDIYRRQLDPEPSLTRFALFVAFFPQLVAGPIERARNLLPQLRNLPKTPREIDWSGSLQLIVRGLFRKVVIADGLAPLVNQVFATPDRYGSVTVAVGVIAFSLQIYGDFAGYTDIARGTARLFGVDLMENFKAPYLSRGFSEFWRRWHISLSTWLRDYLYIPLGGSRGSRFATARNMMVTMLLGGLWHGAAWGFVIWGGLHGAYLMIERWARRGRTEPSEPRGKLPATVVFAVVTLTWIPFRAPTLSVAGEVMGALFGPLMGTQLTAAPLVVGLMGLLTLIIDNADVAGQVDPVERVPSFLRGVAYGSAVVLAILFASVSAIPFIYFQF